MNKFWVLPSFSCLPLYIELAGRALQATLHIGSEDRCAVLIAAALNATQALVAGMRTLVCAHPVPGMGFSPCFFYRKIIMHLFIFLPLHYHWFNSLISIDSPCVAGTLGKRIFLSQRNLIDVLSANKKQ
jgi:hypothetical protein